MTSTSQQPVNSPHTSKDDTAFPPDSYTVQLGDSFTSRPSKRSPSFYSFKFNSGGDDRSTSNRKVSLSKVNDDSYTVEYAPFENASDNTEMTFDAIPGSVQELDCVLVFDEETKTFTLERPLMKFTLRNLRRKRAALAVPTPSSTPSKPAKRQKKSTKGSSVAGGKDKKSGNNRNAGATTTAATTATKTTGDNTNRAAEQRRSSVDDADLISKDIDAVWDDVLGDDDEDDDEDERGQSSKNMTAASPGVSDTDTFEEVIVHETTPTTNRRKIKMASQPIRRPDSPRREFAGKTYSPATAASISGQSQRRASISSDGSGDDDDDGSSSGSSSSSDSSSGSSSGSESGSSESDSSDDEDMTDLIENVERGMDETSAPASPAHQFATTSTPGAFEASPYTSSPATAPRSTPARNGGPVSLRALFDDPTQQDDESITSSDSDSSDNN